MLTILCPTLLVPKARSYTKRLSHMPSTFGMSHAILDQLFFKLRLFLEQCAASLDFVPLQCGTFFYNFYFKLRPVRGFEFETPALHRTSKK